MPDDITRPESPDGVDGLEGAGHPRETGARPTRRRPAVWAAAVLAALGLATFVLVWFQPQKLFIDDEVDEAVPTVAAGPEPAEEADAADAPAPEASNAPTPTDGSATSTPPAPADPVDLARGAFVSRDHTTTGTVRVLELSDGGRYVRLEGLATDNGPDLYVYLSTNPAGGDEGAFDDDAVDLGRLRGNIGDQNYEIPADLDLERYASVVIWCDRFDSAFGAADIAPA